MATQLLDAHPDPDDDQIRHYLSGNLCRCAAYPEIINAVKIAARKRKAARVRCGQDIPDVTSANLRRRRAAAVGTGRFLTFPWA